jgi:uncharacterized membrane protein
MCSASLGRRAGPRGVQAGQAALLAAALQQVHPGLDLQLGAGRPQGLRRQRPGRGQQPAFGDGEELGHAGRGQVAPVPHGPLAGLAEEAVGAVLHQRDAVAVAPGAHGGEGPRQAKKLGHDEGARAGRGRDGVQGRQAVGAEGIELHDGPGRAQWRHQRRAVVARRQHAVAGLHAQGLHRGEQGRAAAGQQPGVGQVVDGGQAAEALAREVVPAEGGPCRLSCHRAGIRTCPARRAGSGHLLHTGAGHRATVALPAIRRKDSHEARPMKLRNLLPSFLIGAVASARAMTPMALIALARLAGRRTPGALVLLEHPLVKLAALPMGVGELMGDKMKTAPDRTVALGMLARVASAGIAGAAVAPPGEEGAGAAVAIATAVPLAHATLAVRKRAMGRIGQTRSGLIEDVLVLAAGVAIVALVTRR